MANDIWIGQVAIGSYAFSSAYPSPPNGGATTSAAESWPTTTPPSEALVFVALITFCYNQD